MKVYLSWSGERSKAVAERLGRWLNQVIQAVEPWIAHQGADGDRWNPQLTEALEGSKVAILCLTRDHLDEPWVLFEAGALASSRNRMLCTFLHDIAPADVRQPLGRLQHATRERGDVWKLLTAVNSAVIACGEPGLEGHLLEQVFRIYWPALEQDLAQLPPAAKAEAEPPRADREILEEILLMLRGQERRLSALERRATTKPQTAPQQRAAPKPEQPAEKPAAKAARATST